ncbi:MAG TPA: helix-turn-helix domain-containing protein, partial [Candidatus Angelobacter sp.]|nr:helix-turn-helix domain-containing protein [Candidatus Angelobacter sp.]
LEERLMPQTSSVARIAEQDYQFLTFRLIQEARPLCKQLWEGLANPELYGQVNSPEAIKKEENAFLSPYQSTMIEIAHGCSVSETESLFELEQRGLIEQVNEKWQVFSEVMQQFVFQQEKTKSQTNTSTPVPNTTSSSDASTERDDEHPLTYLEGKVYDYLKSHLGDVCDKREIMQAVWEEDNMPSNSALQKIIERIREKIEDDPDSPYKLIAVRGRGYMLRKAL